MGSKIKILVPIVVALIVVAGVLVFILTRHHAAKPKPKTVAAKSCSLLSSTEATKLLGKGTVLQQEKTSKVENVNVVGCDYLNKQSSKSIVIGQKTAMTNYGQQGLNNAFFLSSSSEARIKFAGYDGFIQKGQTGNIRIWFKNTWVQVFSPSQTMSEEILTGFVKSH